MLGDLLWARASCGLDPCRSSRAGSVARNRVSFWVEDPKITSVDIKRSRLGEDTEGVLEVEAVDLLYVVVLKADLLAKARPLVIAVGRSLLRLRHEGVVGKLLSTAERCVSRAGRR
jgi:hypothetical protein